MQNQFPDMKMSGEFHMTIQFLGDEIENEMAKKIIDSLSKIRFQPFEIQMGDAHPFPNPTDPRGVWIECKEPDELIHFANEIRDQMKALKLIPDKPFKAHITLGRYKHPLSKEPVKIKGEPHRFMVDKFYLMESKLASDGAKYKIAEEFPASN
jgi:2'-5' RNA ligase